MDDLAFLRERIESYADYTNDDARRLADEQIRAYVGEALSRLGERLRPSDGVADALSRVLLRCQFADQLVIRALDAEDVGEPGIAALHRADRELVMLGDRADALSGADLGSFVAQVDAALEARKRTILDGVPASQLPPG